MTRSTKVVRSAETMAQVTAACSWSDTVPSSTPPYPTRLFLYALPPSCVLTFDMRPSIRLLLSTYPFSLCFNCLPPWHVPSFDASPLECDVSLPSLIHLPFLCLPPCSKSIAGQASPSKSDKSGIYITIDANLTPHDMFQLLTNKL